MASLTMLAKVAAALSAVIFAGCGDLTPPGRRADPDAAGPKPPVPAADGGVPCGTYGGVFKDDVDHDGFTAWWQRRCGQLQQVRFGLPGDDDCDDTDATRVEGGWHDADGDGFTLRAEECFATLPAGFLRQRSRDVDCDDEDPTRQITLQVDADGDGFGAPNQTRCVKFVEQGAVLPDGLSRDTRDCDDADGSRHPGAYEQWNDGVDSDCDGIDAPLVCARADCGCQLRDFPPPMIEPTCSGADLFVAARIVCRSVCGAYNVVVIGNRGTESLLGGFDLELDGDAARLPVRGELAAGANSLPLKLRAGPANIRIVSSPSECDATNNTAPLDALPIPCVD